MQKRQVYRMSQSLNPQFQVLNNFRISDLIELRKLRRARQGIDVTKLHKGDAKRRQKRAREGEEGEEEDKPVKPDLKKGTTTVDEDEYVVSLHNTSV